jgi:heat shock protein HspQ
MMIALNRPKRQFDVGQLVKHRRYGYRGVVVAFDHSCQAPENWYHSNQTQPDINQPWYHVLVHQSDTVTYAAQSSLMADEEVAAIEHPLIDVFFSDLVAGRYIRNDRPWPSE